MKTMATQSCQSILERGTIFMWGGHIFLPARCFRHQKANSVLSKKLQSKIFEGCRFFYTQAINQDSGGKFIFFKNEVLWK